MDFNLTNFKNLTQETREVDNKSQRDFSLIGKVSPCLDYPLDYRVEFLLKRIGKSQNDMANFIQINKGTMSKIVNGGWLPTSKIMLLMGQFLQVDSVILFGDCNYWLNWRNKIGYPKEASK